MILSLLYLYYYSVLLTFAAGQGCDVVLEEGHTSNIMFFNLFFPLSTSVVFLKCFSMKGPIKVKLFSFVPQYCLIY